MSETITPPDQQPQQQQNSNKRHRPDAPSNNKEQRRPQQPHSKRKNHFEQQPKSSFGRVMTTVPCRNQPRHNTLSLAIPGSALANCVTKELQTLWAGQIARAATIYHVDEIIVFDDKLTVIPPPWNHRDRSRPRRNENKSKFETTTAPPPLEIQQHKDASTTTAPDTRTTTNTNDPHLFLARILQYCECPQYLRKHFFPMHPDLQYTGLLPPVDAPHHVRALDRTKYREGVVLDRTGVAGNSLVHCGIPNKPVEINTRLTPGIRCTVHIDSYTTSHVTGTVVSPSAPRLDNGTYWGYTVRVASSLTAALQECPYDGDYDFKIGTSERGTHNMESKSYAVPAHYQHALLVIGGVAGLEECVNADESIALTGQECSKLFDHWVNLCPYQGSRTIRTEEAVWIALAKFSPLLANAANNDATTKKKKVQPAILPAAEFSDEPSDESSDDDGDDGSD